MSNDEFATTDKRSAATTLWHRELHDLPLNRSDALTMRRLPIITERRAVFTTMLPILRMDKTQRDASHHNG